MVSYSQHLKPVLRAIDKIGEAGSDLMQRGVTLVLVFLRNES